MVPRRILAISSVFVISLGINPVNSQIIPDGTTNTSLLNNCQNSCDIKGGIVAGQNLFHSFQEFNVSGGESVYFADPGVTNIFSRITGNNSSGIFGTLGVTGGAANLFLLNPNGIVFGSGANLDLNGSFFATTADKIQFGDRSFFSANPDSIEDLALLTVNPSALFFNQLGQNGSIILEDVNLTIPAQKDFTLLGQDLGQGVNTPGILLQNSSINVLEGNIVLGAVKDHGKIGIADNLQLQFPEDVNRGDIFLTEASNITATTLGNFEEKQIQINAGNLEITGNSNIFSATVGTQDGNGVNINIDAQESVKIIGENSQQVQKFIASNLTDEVAQELLSSGLQTATVGIGKAGDITINTPRLMIDNGGGIVSSTINQGQSGNITIDVADIFALKGSGVLTGSDNNTVGKVGEIQINTGQLLVEQGGIISSSTLGDGNAGNLTVNATESIHINETPMNSIVATGIFTNTIFGNGKGGNLTINTSELVLENGGQLASSSGALTSNGAITSGGEGGSIDIVAELIKVDGRSANETFTSSILSDTQSDQPAGNLTINTDNLLVTSNGFVSASSLGTGAGGDVNITAQDTVELSGPGISNLEELIIDGLRGRLDIANTQGGIAAFTVQDGRAGNITINTSSLNLNNGAIISTATYGDDHAGKLDINASEMIDVRGSVIISPTFGAGNGGILELETKDLSITEGGAIASASIGIGNAGNLSIFAESILLADTIPNLIFSGSISTGSYGSLGLPGKLEIHTEGLSIKGGAGIQTNNVLLLPPKTLEDMTPAASTDSNQNRLIINASEFIEISGSATGENPFNSTPHSHISSITETSNPASNVLITTKKLSIFDYGEISVSSGGDGAAGRLEIMADMVALKNEGNLSGTTSSGRGGDIILQVQDTLYLQDNSVINTNADLGNGGNIEIFADFIVASGNSSISANAAAVGNGGQVNISANGLFLTADSTITADSNLGIDGTVEIDASVNTEGNNITKLPQQVMETENMIMQSCSNNDNLGEFSYTGRGGLPFNPLTDFQANDIIIADFDLPRDTISDDQFAINKILNPPSKPTVVEANQWQVNNQGKVELIASNNNNHDFLANKFNPSNCPLSRYK